MRCFIHPDNRYWTALSLDHRPTRLYDFSARMRNMGQLIRWMELLYQTNPLSNWSGARHSHSFWESPRTWKWLRFHLELCRNARKTSTSERIFDEMSGIARLTKSNCSSRTDACMKGPRASNKSLKNARECFAPPSHLRLESERHKWCEDAMQHRSECFLDAGQSWYCLPSVQQDQHAWSKHRRWRRVLRTPPQLLSLKAECHKFTWEHASRFDLAKYEQNEF